MTPCHHQLQARLCTPLGPVTVARSARGLSGLWFDAQQHHPGALPVPTRDDDPLFEACRQALRSYFEGMRLPVLQARLPMPGPLDSLLGWVAESVALDPAGTAFQRSVWQALLEIPAGSSQTYGDLARALGRPTAARAVGAAVGRNPISLLIPCHRVLGTQGQLTGYAGGLHRKTALLRLEGAVFKEAA